MVVILTDVVCRQIGDIILLPAVRHADALVQLLSLLGTELTPDGPAAGRGRVHQRSVPLPAGAARQPAPPRARLFQRRRPGRLRLTPRQLGSGGGGTERSREV